MLTADSIRIGYHEKCVVNDFSFHFEKGKIYTIIGPNGSGKSTVVKALSRLLPHRAGTIDVAGKHIECYHTKALSQILAVLSQTNHAPSDFTVRDLLRFGRMPHKKFFQPIDASDEAVVDWAMAETHLEPFAHRRVCSLSGGERQRAWIAMNLVQQPQLLILDEPTTYLDIQHQFEVMELVKTLNRTLKMTVVMILHDLNQASLYSDEIIVIKDGVVVSSGPPEAVMTEQLIGDVYKIQVTIARHQSGRPMVFPVGI